MPLAVECRYVIFHNGAITTAAFRSEHVEVVLAAVRLTVSLVEALFAELLAALSAEEMLGVPGLLQGGHAFLEKIFFATANLLDKIFGGLEKKSIDRQVKIIDRFRVNLLVFELNND